MSRLVLGTAAFGPYAGQPALQPWEIIPLLRAAADAGIRWIDTAPSYGGAEEAIGAALAYRFPNEFLVATKVAADADYLTVRASVRRSLAQLRRERLDLVYVHNATTRVRSSPALDALRRAHDRGQVGRIGATVYTEAEALAAIEADLNVIQVPYHLLDRRMRATVFEAARHAGVTVYVRSVWARGLLTPRLIGDDRFPVEAFADAERIRFRLWTTWEQLPDVALQFALHDDRVAGALIGVRTPQELDQAVQAATRRLPWWRAALAATWRQNSDPKAWDPRTWGA